MDILIDADAWARAAAGGAMIGLAAALMFALSGRIAGVSGVLGNLVLERRGPDTAWRGMFLLGLILGALLMGWLRPDLARPVLQTGWAGMIAGGIVVGFGTRMGGGCTSGHGICGIARLSKRSLLATATFLATGFLTVFLLRHVLAVSS